MRLQIFWSYDIIICLYFSYIILHLKLILTKMRYKYNYKLTLMPTHTSDSVPPVCLCLYPSPSVLCGEVGG